MRGWIKAPALAGAFVIFAGCAQAIASGGVELALQLMEDGCRAESQRECVRILTADPEHAAAREMQAAAMLRMPNGAARSRASSAASAPGRALVWIYRSMVRPAIGARCSLDPSCSEYFLLTSRRHGLLGFPMMADRLVREPSVVHAHPVPAPPGSGVRVPDPVSDHDFWMRPRRAASGSNRKAQP